MFVVRWFVVVVCVVVGFEAAGDGVGVVVVAIGKCQCASDIVWRWS